ncbi:excalibur calcium-binding domain-containing protein [Aneurinibacillus migulanus]|uniref:excalibur calcium-binding domain-containing protein n=1 Tax=Aneurinibacillus migulanus TaxID=47500 RepID=UPI002E250862
MEKTQPATSVPPHTQTSNTSSSDVQYKNCTEARSAGVTPIYEGQPRDGDGIACE